MTNVLIVHDRYQYSGGEDSVYDNEVRLLKNAGYQVWTYEKNNRLINSMPIWKKALVSLHNVFSLRIYREIVSIIKSNNIQLIHVHNTLPLIGASVFWAAFSKNIPIVQTLHNFRMECPGGTLYVDGNIHEECIQHPWKSVRLKCYRHSSVQTFAVLISMLINRYLGVYRRVYFICLTDFSKHKLLELNQANQQKVVDPNKIFVKPNFSFEVTNATDRKLPENLRGKKYFLYVGRLSAEKGIMELMQSWNLADTVTRRLVICGDGPLADECREFVAKNGSQGIDFLGQVNHDEIFTLLRNSESLIVPSQCYETFGMGVIEAMSVGTPVIASNLGSLSDLVKPGVTGELVDPHSRNALGDAIRNFDSRDYSRERIKKIYKLRYSEEVNLKLLTSIYEEVLAS